MKIAQLRRVLDTVAKIQYKAGRSTEAEALSKLALALKAADKEQVAKAVEKLTR